MQRLLVILAAISILAAPSAAQELNKIPTKVQVHMERMVGSWTFEGRQGDRKFRGAETIRLTSQNTALVQEGYFDLGNGKKETYIIVSGWDGEKNTIVVRGFTSDGISWAGEWKTLSGGKWQGTASGGAASFEVKRDTMRYQDDGDGTPWISEFTRKKE